MNLYMLNFSYNNKQYKIIALFWEITHRVLVIPY